MIERWRAGRRREAGNVAIPFAVSVILMLGLAAVVIDLSHARVVKRELQKAAEAGALTGARALALDPTQPAPHLALSLNWSNGSAQGTNAVKNNYVNSALLNSFSATSTVPNPDGTTTTIYNVETGYWDVRWTLASAPANLNGYLDPDGYRLGTNGGPPTAYEIPAVKVTVAQTQGGGGGTAPMTTVFASLLGVSSMTMQASAVAILPSPTKIKPGGLFPFALPQSYVSANWNANPPTSFTVGSSQHDSSGGQWTTFENSGQVGASTVSGYVINGNDVAIGVGDPIYIQNGEQGSVYNTVSNQLAAYPGRVYMVAVVEDNFPTGATTPVLAFVPFKVTGCSGSGNNPYVTGQFVPGYMSPKASGVSGTYYGDPDRPELVQ